MDVLEPPGFPRRPQGSAKEADPTAICRSDTAQCGSMFLGSTMVSNMVVWALFGEQLSFLCRCVFQIVMSSCSHLRGVVVVVLVVAAVLVAAVVVVVVVLVVAAVVVAAAALAFVATVVAVACCCYIMGRGGGPGMRYSMPYALIDMH